MPCIGTVPAWQRATLERAVWWQGARRAMATCLALLATVAGGSWAAPVSRPGPPPTAPAPASSIQAAALRVRVGVLANLPPLQFWPAGARAPTGADIDLLNALERPSGLRFEFSRYASAAELERALLDGRVQLATSMAYTPERAGPLRFSSSYVSLEQALVVRQEDDDAPGNLVNRRQAVVVPGLHGAAGAATTAATGRQVPAVSLEEALAAIQRRDADWLQEAEPVLRELIERHRMAGLRVLRDPGFADGQLRLAMRQEDAALAEKLDQALATLPPEQVSHWMEDWSVHTLHSGAGEPAFELTAAERAQLAAMPPLRVGYFPRLLPFSDQRPDGRPEGLGIDVARAVLDRLGLRVGEWVPLSLGEMLDAARQGRIDMALGLSESPERRAYLRFVGSYYADPYVLVGRQRAGAFSLTQLRGRRLALPAGHVLTGYLRGQYPEVQLVPCDRLADCLRLVDSGGADATLGGLMTVQARLADREFRRLLISGALERMSNEHAMSVVRPQEHLAPLLRRALEDVQANDLPDLQRKWSSREGGPRWGEVIRWSAAAAGLVTLLLGAGIWHNRVLRRQVDLRRKALARAEQERSAAERYLAFLAHEVRNSLHAVKAGVALLAADPPRERPLTPAELSDQRGTLNALRYSTGATLTLLNELLDRHRLQAGGLKLSLKPERLADVVNAVTEELRPAATEKGLALEAAHVPELWLMLDALRLQQILRNLLVNAIKFTPGGTVRVACEAAPAGPGQYLLRLSVSDSGPGLPLHLVAMPPADVPLSIETQPGDRPGSGLGLALSRELARLMDGDIRAENHLPPQRGATFCLSLTAVAAPTPTRPALQTASRVLLLEDDPVYRMLLQHAFIQMGAEVVPVGAVRQARAQLQRGSFTLVLSDAHLGDGGPADLLPDVKALPDAPPMVVMSGHMDEASAATLRAAGAVDCLEKDPDVSQMVRRVLGALAEATP